MKFSYSRLSLYDTCPRKFKYKYIDGHTLADSAIFEKGKFLHALLEHYPNLAPYEFSFKEVQTKVPEYVKMIFDLCKTNNIQFLLKNVLYREKQFYLNDKLENCSEEDSLVNGIIDYVGRTKSSLIIADWKSGQTTKYASEKQLRLYSIWAFNEFPEINTIKCLFCFIEQNKIISYEVHKNELPTMKLELLEKISKILKETEYKKNIKDECKYCDFYNDCKPYNVQMKGKTNG